LGDQTGGGGGAPSSGELPNGWQYRLSVTQTIDLNGEQIEPGVGVDVPVQMREPDLRRNRDTLIETALRMLRSEEHTSELQSRENLVCRLLLEKKKHKVERNRLHIYWN